MSKVIILKHDRTLMKIQSEYSRFSDTSLHPQKVSEIALVITFKKADGRRGCVFGKIPTSSKSSWVTFYL